MCVLCCPCTARVYAQVITSIAVWNFYRYKSLLGFCALMYVRSFLDALDGDVYVTM